MSSSFGPERIAILTALLLVAIPASAFLYVVLWPLREAEKQRQLPTQFHVADTIWLIVWMQIALSTTMAYMPTWMGNLYYVAMGFASLAVPLGWWGSVRALSRAGVHPPGRRVLFLAVIVPITWFAALAPGFALVEIVGLFEFWPEDEEPIGKGTLLVLVTVLTPAMAWALRRLTLWVLDVGAAALAERTPSA